MIITDEAPKLKPITGTDHQIPAQIASIEFLIDSSAIMLLADLPLQNEQKVVDFLDHFTIQRLFSYLQPILVSGQHLQAILAIAVQRHNAEHTDWRRHLFHPIHWRHVAAVAANARLSRRHCRLFKRTQRKRRNLTK